MTMEPPDPRVKREYSSGQATPKYRRATTTRPICSFCGDGLLPCEIAMTGIPFVNAGYMCPTCGHLYNRNDNPPGVA